MANAKAFYIRKTAALSFPLFLYFIASVFRSQTWGNIISPVNALMDAGILLFAYIKSDKHNPMRFVFLLSALACLSWGAADVTWAIMDHAGGDPSESPVIWVIYVLTNAFLVISLLVFTVNQFSKWNFVQFCVDLLTIGLFGLVSLWIVFMNKDITIINACLSLDFTSLFSILSDIVMFICVFLWLLSVRSGKAPRYIQFYAFGIFLFAFADILYYYLAFHEMYIPNSLIDFVYILSLYMIALGGYFSYRHNGPSADWKTITNIGMRSRWFFLLAIPLATVFVDVTGIMPSNFNALDGITYALLLFLYLVFSKYVQLSIENEKLLRIQLLDNRTLEQRVKEQVKELAYLANQDTLTSLYNRRYFMKYLCDSIQTIRPRETLALMLMDLDRFKTINDSYGHDTGDAVLIELANRMTLWNNYGAILARLGGDEFGFIFIGKYTHKELDSLCAQLTQLCSKSIAVGGKALEITISIGVSLLSEDAADEKTLMKNADIAMYQAKSQGYNRHQFFDPIFSQDMINSNKIEILLKQADIEKDFELFYQPQYSLPDKKLIGAEALLRWKNTEHGYIPPNVFIPVAEKIEYIAKIGKWVLNQSILQAIEWNSRQMQPIKIGINISPRQLDDDAFIEILKALVINTGVNASWLDAEITESNMVCQTDKVHAVFELLKELGISISIDDFGSGYSALNYLNKYPFDRIKIDKSLIDNISSYNISGTHIVKSIIAMAKSIGITTIAEGVESEEQLDVLEALGCDQVQGYLLGRPVPAGVFEMKFLNPN